MSPTSYQAAPPRVRKANLIGAALSGQAASAHGSVKHRLKHFFYSAGRKNFERAWDLVIRIKQLSQMRPLLEAVLARVATSEADPAPEGLPDKPRELPRLPAISG